MSRTFFRLLVAFASLLQSSLELVQILGGKLCFALVALSVCVVSETAEMHVLAAFWVRAHGYLIIRVEYLSAHATRLELWDTRLRALIVTLSEEEHIKVVQILISHSPSIADQIRVLFHLLVLLHEFSKPKHFHVLDDVSPTLLNFLICPHQLKS